VAESVAAVAAEQAVRPVAVGMHSSWAAGAGNIVDGPGSIRWLVGTAVVVRGRLGFDCSPTARLTMSLQACVRRFPTSWVDRTRSLGLTIVL